MKATALKSLTSAAFALFFAASLALTGCSTGTLTGPEEAPAEAPTVTDSHTYQAAGFSADRNEANKKSGSTDRSAGRNEVVEEDEK